MPRAQSSSCGESKRRVAVVTKDQRDNLDDVFSVRVPFLGNLKKARLTVTGQVATVKKATIAGLMIVSLTLLWAVLPLFIESPDRVLVLTVTSSAYPACPMGSTCFTLELRNLGPWPVTVDIIEWRFYPALIGPSVDVNWLGPTPDRRLSLMPFTAQTYMFGLRIIAGLNPPETIYVTLAGYVTVLYRTQHVVLHSGKR